MGKESELANLGEFSTVNQNGIPSRKYLVSSPYPSFSSSPPISQSDSGGTVANRYLSGTEQDRVNCSFYLKIGACRHGDRCSRKHIKPQFSQTILLPNVYNNPAHTPEGAKMGQAELQRNFDGFYEDFWVELCKYGNLVEMHVSLNHLTVPLSCLYRILS